MKQTQTRRRRDAGLTQCRRKADAERRRTDASQKRPEAWTQEGRRRKHQLLSSTHNIYCIWLFRSIKEIHISFLVTLLYFSRNNTLHKMEKSNKDSQIFSFRALNASASGCVRVASNYQAPSFLILPSSEIYNTAITLVQVKMKGVLQSRVLDSWNNGFSGHAVNTQWWIVLSVVTRV